MAELKKLFLETDVDKLMELVEKKKKITIKEAAAHLGEDEAVVEDWIKILEGRGYLKISYPIAGPPFIEMGEKKVSESEEEENLMDIGKEESSSEIGVEEKPDRKEIHKKQKSKKEKHERKKFHRKRTSKKTTKKKQVKKKGKR